MTASFWLAAALACAQVGPTTEPIAPKPAQDVSRQAENVPPPRPAASKITEVTVYQGQALVTREVSVPEGDGTVELVVTPLPPQTVDSSLYTEGTDGLRVLSTRFRTRAIKEDTRLEVRAKQELIKKLDSDAQRLQKEIAVQQEDLVYLQKLGGFTSTALTGLSEKGRLDSEAIVSLRVVDKQRPDSTPTEKDSPSVTFAVGGRLDIPSRRDPQLLEVARVDLTAEYYAKAVPVLTPRVYRLAKLTNKSDVVLLPGEATVYVGTDFVGRMRLPLVAAGEPFIAGFGVDPQLQVSRRLVRKSRSVQGGNQIYEYEFRLGLRNYRKHPVKLQLWDRLPKPQGEAVAVNLVKTSVPLSTDPPYERTARMDNLLRWDLDLPQGTVADKTIYLNYEFRLEYARDLPQPQFLSGGLRERPIGGGAMGMGGMGGGMGGMRSVKSEK